MKLVGGGRCRTGHPLPCTPQNTRSGSKEPSSGPYLGWCLGLVAVGSPKGRLLRECVLGLRCLLGQLPGEIPRATAA